MNQQLIEHTLYLTQTVGVPVFPCDAATKQPLTKNGFKDASRDLAQIRAWWSRHPNAMIGMPTGEASGIDAIDLDIDQAKGLDGVKALSEVAQEAGYEIPVTQGTRTPRGGRHLYFRHKPGGLRNRTAAIKPGIDIRGEGGYVIMPGSVRADGLFYEWTHDPSRYPVADLPDWLEKLLLEKPARTQAPHNINASPSFGHRHHKYDNPYVRAAFDAEIQSVSSASAGSRNDALNRAAFSLGQFVPGGHLSRGDVEGALYQAAEGVGLVADDGERSVRATIASGLNAGAGEPRNPPEGANGFAPPCGSGQANTKAGPDNTKPEGWPEPDLAILGTDRQPAPPLPIGPNGPFGPYWSDWIRAAAEAVSSPPDYVATSLLSASASLIGSSRRVSPWEGWSEPCIIWGGLIGNPSSGKSPALEVPIGLLRAIEEEKGHGYKDDVRQWEANAEAASIREEGWKNAVKNATVNENPPPPKPEEADAGERPVRPRLVLSDATVEAAAKIHERQPKGLILVRDELAGWLGSMDRYGGDGRDRAFYIEAYGGRPFVVDRAKNPEPIVIPNLSISLLGGIQPDRLASGILNTDDDGLAARLMMVWPNPVLPDRPKRIIDQIGAINAFRRLATLEMATDTNGKPAPVIVRLTDSAADMFNEWQKESAQSESQFSGMLLSFLGKTKGLALRLALVLEHLYWVGDRPAADPPLQVSSATMAHALTFVEDYVKPMAVRVYGDAGAPVPVQHAMRIARYIVEHRPNTINLRDLRSKVGVTALKNAKFMTAAIDVLEDHDWIAPAFDREGKARGRRRKDYAVNPRLWDCV
ncbi:MAG: DUF3987 domain-containing protein [Pseudomonadota bacterium]